MIPKSSFCTCLFLGATMVALGQSRQENLNNCQSVDPDAKIAGCTALLKADQETAKNRAVIYGSRGVGYYSKGDYDRAIQDTDQAIRLNPNEPSFYYTSGLAYKKKGNFDRAIQDFDEAIRLNPTFERAYYDRGNAYIDKEEYNRAIQDLNRAIQDYNQAIHLNSSDTAAYLNRGIAYFAQSNLTAAIADFEHTISAAPSSSAAVSAALLLHVVMKREGHDDAKQLARVAAAADLSKWPGPVLKLDLGQITASEVMAAAASGVSAWQKWQVCEANYYIGEDALLHHQRAMALAHFRAARESCPKGATDYAAAMAELKRIGESAIPAK